jgi:hypothetical protein
MVKAKIDNLEIECSVEEFIKIIKELGKTQIIIKHEHVYKYTYDYPNIKWSDIKWSDSSGTGNNPFKGYVVWN